MTENPYDLLGYFRPKNVSQSFGDGGRPQNELDLSRDWADMMTEDDSYISRAKDYREPGRLASVHEKLMSPSRKKSEKNSEAHRLEIEIRQSEAARRRQEIQRSKTEKVRKIAEKVESVQKNKNSVQLEKQKRLDQKETIPNAIRFGELIFACDKGLHLYFSKCHTQKKCCTFTWRVPHKNGTVRP